MQKRTKHWLIAIFILTIIIRLSLAFIVPNFTYDSYFHLRQVEHITETGTPIYSDDLSYGGRELIFLPFFHYFMAFFDLFLPLTIIAKIIPNLLLASLIAIVYLISKKITNNDNASLLSAFITGFLPILFFTNSFIPETLFLALVFLAIYSFLKLKEKKFLYIYIFTFLILSLTSSATFLILIGFGIYLLLSLVEGKKIGRAEIELILFSFLFFVWIQFLFFKKTLLIAGVDFIWQNVPSQILLQYFPKFSIAEALILVSIIPFIAGIFVVYRSLFQLKNQKAFLLISFAVSTTLLTWFQLIKFKLALAFFGLILAILFAQFYIDLAAYLQKTKLKKIKKYLLSITIVLLLISTAIPAITTALDQDTPTNQEIDAFIWLKKNTIKEATVLALLEEGHLVNYYGERKNLMDEEFTRIKDVEKRFSNLNSLFATRFQTQALSILDEYKIQYLVLTPRAKEKYNIKKLNYLSRECFEKKYDENGIRVYLVKCKLAEIGR